MLVYIYVEFEKMPRPLVLFVNVVLMMILKTSEVACQINVDEKLVVLCIKVEFEKLRLESWTG
jgi:hypothetical protein